MIDSFRLTEAAARKYQRHSVPAMFGPLAEKTVDLLRLKPDMHVLDVACGTGALTRAILKALKGRCRILGTDLNQTMIDVAREMTPDSPHNVDWLAADVTDLPLKDSGFDLACIQQGLQFFPDKPAALHEIHRVLRSDGRLCLTCWKEISPFNDSLATALEHHINPQAAEKARAPFSYRDGHVIQALLGENGFAVKRHAAIVLHRRFADLGEQILALPIEKDLRDAGEEKTRLVIDTTSKLLAPYDTDGVFIVPQEAHFFEARCR
ncbi:Demethylmenaquinone methyltransferase [Falsiruegeria litorea R37]|uniref:Demethylmenaquinone methyltransferase n=1 Tax=Falsiruegeria litorea R37 TaxID=1200284 RepID=A0A1Y5RE73_9RHOB|nr:methyltransferase domain-containing protein [Falsiruegeria litorea]SLN15001.1 Demethylmenaquinone methyltransferase [Falsiruegeria litorea R37]